MTVLRDLIYAVVAVAVTPFLLWSMWTKRKHRTGWRGRFGHAELPADVRKTVLIHAVSVGEVNATRTLVQALADKHGDRLRIVVSATTDTGFARANDLYGGDHHVVRYPLDFSWMVRRFLNAVQPDVVLLMELELWPGFVAACVKRRIPVAVINGRLSERSFRGYRRFKPIIGPTFAGLSAACVQDEAYARRFAAMGVIADRLHVTGTMKWDTAERVDVVDGMDELADALGIDRDRPLIVCGSSGPGEEAMFVDQLGELADAAGRPVQLLIAPRKPERFDEAAAAIGECVRRSRHLDGRRAVDGASRFLLDSIGDLRKAYALADVAVVGRSFCPLYGSDMIEPIALGKATVIGPNTSDFADSMSALLAGEGIVQVADGRQLREQVRRLLDPAESAALGERGRAVIRDQRGATQRHLEWTERLLGLD